ncbi:Enoyl-(Acyl carrier protein) reductase-like protein 4 [Elsinoe fawcettii]|nr:Enoyl-(Acyl carrier protein) reductase-like protein 4 [Elsinoe fawcettii]
MTVASKVFAVTGGASGMGLATCKLLAQRGARGISIADFNEKSFDAAKRDIAAANPKTEVVITKVDVSDSASVAAWIDATVARFKALDGALNAAGVPQGPNLTGEPSIFAETENSWKKVMEVNIDGVYYACREEIRAMLQLGAAPRSIVNIASIAPAMHRGMMYAYGASKTAVLHFSENLAVEMRPKNIRVNDVMPGPVATPMLDTFVPLSVRDHLTKTEGLELVKPEEVAHTIVWLLSEDSPNVSGVHIPIGKGMP